MLAGSSSESHLVSAAPPDESIQAITAQDIGSRQRFDAVLCNILLNNLPVMYITLVKSFRIVGYLLICLRRKERSSHYNGL